MCKNSNTETLVHSVQEYSQNGVQKIDKRDGDTCAQENTRPTRCVPGDTARPTAEPSAL
jgi:hypothetical protein